MLIAIPFIALWTLGLLAVIVGRLGWFLDDPRGAVFVLLWAGTWVGGTHFYQPARHRRPGLILFLMGVALGIAAWRALGRWYVPDPNISPGQRLITSGPYRLVRHPMYTALLLSLPALPLLLRSLWGLALSLVLIVPALWLRIRQEEAMLLIEVGDEYREYMAHTWRLVPFVL